MSVAHVATLGLAVMLKSTGLTKIVPAPEGHSIDNGITLQLIIHEAILCRSRIKEAYFVTMGLLKDSLQMKHLKGISSSSLLTS